MSGFINDYKIPEVESKWKFWLARIFGVKRVTIDGNVKHTFYYFNGAYWLWSEEFGLEPEDFL